MTSDPGTREELLKLLRDLIRIDSTNPPGDTRELAGFAMSWLRERGLEPTLVVADEHRPALLVEINPGARPNLLYHTHLDTATVGEHERWSYDPFGAEIRGDRMYGRGASDAKSALAAMMMAVVLASRTSMSGSLTLAAVSDEETGSELGTAHLLAQGRLAPDWVVVGESTANRIAIAERGMLWLEVTVYGRAAHASSPGDGISAISKMMRFLMLLEDELGQSLAGRSHPLTLPPSITLGVVEGGTRPNVVADRCRVVLDRRVLPSETVASAAAEVEQLLQEMSRRDPEFSGKLRVVGLPGRPYETDRDHPLVRAVAGVCQQLDLPDEPTGYQQASDGRFFAQTGVPTVVLGPGRPDSAHRENEFVMIPDVILAERVYAMLAERTVAEGGP